MIFNSDKIFPYRRKSIFASLLKERKFIQKENCLTISSMKKRLFFRIEKFSIGLLNHLAKMSPPRFVILLSILQNNDFSPNTSKSDVNGLLFFIYSFPKENPWKSPFKY